MTDVIYSMAVLNVMLSAVSVYCVYWLIGEFTNQSKTYMLLGMFAYMGFIPLCGSAYYVYSDGISMGMSVIGMTLLVYARKYRKICYFLGGILLGIAFLVKPTAVFCAIGFLIVEFLLREHRRFCKSVLLIFAGFFLIYGSFGVIKEKMPYHTYSAEYKMPTQFWVALGMFGAGTYEENGWFVAQCILDYDYEGRIEFCNRLIKENYTNLWDERHIAKKIIENFADGHFGLREYTSDVTYPYFSEEGTYDMPVTVVLSAYFYVMLLVIWLSSVKLLTCGSEGAEFLLAICIDIFGMIVFLILWEANNRQLYNHMPWFAMGLSLGLYQLFQKKQAMRVSDLE